MKLTCHAEGSSRFSDSSRTYDAAQIFAAVLENDAN